MTILHSQFCPSSCHFLPLSSSYSSNLPSHRSSSCVSGTFCYPPCRYARVGWRFLNLVTSWRQMFLSCFDSQHFLLLQLKWQIFVFQSAFRQQMRTQNGTHQMVAGTSRLYFALNFFWHSQVRVLPRVHCFKCIKLSPYRPWGMRVSGGTAPHILSVRSRLVRISPGRLAAGMHCARAALLLTRCGLSNEEQNISCPCTAFAQTTHPVTLSTSKPCYSKCLFQEKLHSCVGHKTKIIYWLYLCGLPGAKLELWCTVNVCVCMKTAGERKMVQCTVYGHSENYLHANKDRERKRIKKRM
jgi:hypothetical protein